MGLIADIMTAASRHRRRGLKEFTLRRGDMMVAGWMTAVLFIRFTANTSFAARTLTSGSHAAGLAITGFCLVNFLVDVVLLSFLFSSLALGAMSLDRRRIGLSPAPFSTLFLSELSGMLVNPMSWIVAPFVVPAVFPLAFLPHPVPAIATLCAVYVAAFLAAWVLGIATSLLPRVARAVGLFRIVFTVVMIALVLANFNFRIDGGRVELFLFQKRAVLSDGEEILPGLGPWPPWVWVMRAARDDIPLPWLLAGIFSAVAMLSLCAFLLRVSHRRAPSSASFTRVVRRHVLGPRRKTLQSLLFFKEISYAFLSSARSWIVLAIGAGFAAWLFATREPTVTLSLIGAFLALTASFPSASNSFGDDGTAVRRYFLASVEWRVLFLAKNLAHVCLVVPPIALLCLATGVKVSAADGLALFVTAALLLTLQLAWGNLSSILLPSASESSRRRADGAQGSFVNQVFPIAIWGIPLLVHRSASYGSTVYTTSMFALFVLAVGLYGILMRGISRRFAAEAERMVERL